VTDQTPWQFEEMKVTRKNVHRNQDASTSLFEADHDEPT